MDIEEVWDRIKEHVSEILSLTRDLPVDDRETTQTNAANTLLGNDLSNPGVLRFDVYPTKEGGREVRIPYDRVIWLGEEEMTHDTSGHLEQYYYVEQNGCRFVVIYIIDGEEELPYYHEEAASIKIKELNCKREDIHIESSL